MIAERILNGQHFARRRPVERPALQLNDGPALQLNDGPALQLNEISLCYFAALIHALRLIDEKAEDKRVTVLQVDADALVHYVRAKGDELVALHLSERKAAA